MKKPLTKSSFRLHVAGIIVCLIIIVWLLPKVINEWGQPPKTEKCIVRVQNHYHWTPKSIRRIPNPDGDPNVFVGTAEYDNTPPEVTRMKDGEEIDQKSNWKVLKKAQNDYFNK